MKTILPKNHVYLLTLYWAETNFLAPHKETISRLYADPAAYITLTIQPDEEITFAAASS